MYRNINNNRFARSLKRQMLLDLKKKKKLNQRYMGVQNRERT